MHLPRERVRTQFHVGRDRVIVHGLLEYGLGLHAEHGIEFAHAKSDQQTAVVDPCRDICPRLRAKSRARLATDDHNAQPDKIARAFQMSERQGTCSYTKLAADFLEIHIPVVPLPPVELDRKSTRLNSSHRTK